MRGGGGGSSLRKKMSTNLGSGHQQMQDLPILPREPSHFRFQHSSCTVPQPHCQPRGHWGPAVVPIKQLLGLLLYGSLHWAAQGC